MKQDYRNWFTAPSLKQVIIITFVWAVSHLLLLLALTDLFQTSPFVKNNIVMGLLILLSTATTVDVLIKCFHNKNRKTA